MVFGGFSELRANADVCVGQEVTLRGGGLKHVACAEDEDFIQALDKMMLENLQVHKQSLNRCALAAVHPELTLLTFSVLSFVALSSWPLVHTWIL